MEKAQLDPSKIRVGYNSHGAWSTLEEIRCEEVERGNYFHKLDYPPDTLAMWICLTPRKALRYVALAERWDHLNDETQPLTCAEEEMLECVAEIPLEPTDMIVHDDGDEGYLVLRPNKATRRPKKIAQDLPLPDCNLYRNLFLSNLRFHLTKRVYTLNKLEISPEVQTISRLFCQSDIPS
jgi:hypothetical protein